MVRLTDRPDMTLDVYGGRKTTTQQQKQQPMQNTLFFPNLTEKIPNQKIVFLIVFNNYYILVHLNVLSFNLKSND